MELVNLLRHSFPLTNPVSLFVSNFSENYFLDWEKIGWEKSKSRRAGELRGREGLSESVVHYLLFIGFPLPL